MNRKLFIFITVITLCLPLTITVAEKVPTLATKSMTALKAVSEATAPAAINCQTGEVASPVYSGQFQSIDIPLAVEPNQIFPVTVKIKNIGNTSWFSSDSGCPGQSPTYLGTTRNQDRDSIFHAPIVLGDTKWLQANRIKMKTPRVDPGETAEFSFAALAPAENGIYREYFSPIVEGKVWIKDQAEFKFDIKVGQPVENDKVLKYTRDMMMSMNLTDPKFTGEKKIIVSLSSQRMTLKLGEVTLKTFPVSTGAPKHPTPVGSTKIISKQEVRVAGSVPHYIMPKFLQFRKGGFGIHALPSLANDHGVYWREALNHIGSPRSHGCIRLLPEDANFTYDFAEVGTTVQVVW